MKVFLPFPWYTFVKLIKEWMKRLDKKLTLQRTAQNLMTFFTKKILIKYNNFLSGARCRYLFWNHF